MKYPFAVMTALGLFASSISPASANNRNVETELASQSDLSVFYQALLNTGVASELNENTQYTVFAPTNAAFAEIQQRLYPCFYATQCRATVAAVLRDHIVPDNVNISRFAERGGGIQTLGTQTLNLEEAYKGDYTADGHRILTEDMGNQVSLYQIDGVIVTDQQLAAFRTQPVAPVASMPPPMMQNTTVTYRTQIVTPSAPGDYRMTPDGYMVQTGYMTPNGYVSAPASYAEPGQAADQDTETTTQTQTTTTR